jgi:hypothetical protein
VFYLEASEDEDGDAEGPVAVGAGNVVLEFEPGGDAGHAEHEPDGLHRGVRVEPEGGVPLEVARQRDPHRHQHAPPEPCHFLTSNDNAPPALTAKP